MNIHQYKQQVLARPESKIEQRASSEFQIKRSASPQHKQAPVYQKPPVYKQTEQINVNFFDRYKEFTVQSSPTTVKTSNANVFQPQIQSQKLNVTGYLESSKPAAVSKTAVITDFLIPYQAPDRTLVMALQCEFDYNTLNGIPYSGSVRVQRKQIEKTQMISDIQDERIRLLTERKEKKSVFDDV
ncbi:Conserved_hypothetical protein [Hexamita inflata]|uniref:Uncharacterized protein n=1 Tax=Hexamita inflata TaxID=28002 RepID=A0AA86QRJ6_9EUKA|nr:Conserved hypothetical protein [Hexamita inflata]